MRLVHEAVHEFFHEVGEDSAEHEGGSESLPAHAAVEGQRERGEAARCEAVEVVGLSPHLLQLAVKYRVEHAKSDETSRRAFDLVAEIEHR